jgi:hypothetical protein
VLFGELAVLAAERGSLDMHVVPTLGQARGKAGREIRRAVDVRREGVAPDKHTKRCGGGGPWQVSLLASIGAVGHDV